MEEKMAQPNAQRADSEDAPPATGSRPVDKIRIGSITGNIWRNTGQNGDYYTASFERMYRDDQGQPKSTDSFRPADLPVVAKASDKVLDRIMELEKGRGR
jgi:hypothetical protein